MNKLKDVGLVISLLTILYLAFSTYYDVQALKKSVDELEKYNLQSAIMMFMEARDE